MKPNQRSCGLMVPITLAVAIIFRAATCVQGQNRIVNGQEVDEGEFPFIVALYEFDDSNSMFICGGSILDERHILTAAHCMSGSKSRFVKLGCHRRSECLYSQFTIDEFIIHPKYRSSKVDLAIIRTNEVIEFTQCEGAGSIDRINFPEAGALDDYVEWESLTVAGWGLGAASAQEPEDVLMKTSLQAIPVAQCGIPSSNYICARAPEANVCGGDSGGPLIRTLPDGTMSLVGVVRGTLSKIGQNDTCDPKYGAVFMRVAAYAKWIRDCMAATTFESGSCSSAGN